MAGEQGALRLSLGGREEAWISATARSGPAVALTLNPFPFNRL
jgi:hypothetical protein